MRSQAMWACDFFSKHVWTRADLMEYFVLFLILVGTRRVQLATLRPEAIIGPFGRTVV